MKLTHWWYALPIMICVIFVYIYWPKTIEGKLTYSHTKMEQIWTFTDGYSLITKFDELEKSRIKATRFIRCPDGKDELIEMDITLATVYINEYEIYNAEMLILSPYERQIIYYTRNGEKRQQIKFCH